MRFARIPDAPPGVRACMSTHILIDLRSKSCLTLVTLIACMAVHISSAQSRHDACHKANQGRIAF